MGTLVSIKQQTSPPPWGYRGAVPPLHPAGLPPRKRDSVYYRGKSGSYRLYSSQPVIEILVSMIVCTGISVMIGPIPGHMPVLPSRPVPVQVKIHPFMEFHIHPHGG